MPPRLCDQCAAEEVFAYLGVHTLCDACYVVQAETPADQTERQQFVDDVREKGFAVANRAADIREQKRRWETLTPAARVAEGAKTLFKEPHRIVPAEGVEAKWLVVSRIGELQLGAATIDEEGCPEFIVCDPTPVLHAS